ncbi:sensor histidine kinase [Streptomyces sp. NPDC004126]|uniref:sensor histidine kinase n=1 Tax=Streptomyces sp. NPDC004126 TaxID=3390695 RepID=UPI003D071F53
MRRPSLLEVAIGAGLVALWLVAGIGGPVAWLLLVVSAGAVLLFGRGAPVIAAGALLVVACGLFPAFGCFGRPVVAIVTAAVGIFLLGTVVERVRGLVAAALLPAALTSVYAFAHEARSTHSFLDRGSLFLAAVVVYAVPAAVGRGLRYRDVARTAAEQRAAALERERDAVEARVRLEERARIAREMHDMIGHRVGNVVALAGGLETAGEALRDGPELAERARLIASEGRSALLELRIVLGLLTSPAVAGGPDPDVAADGLASLARSTALAGDMPVELTVDGHVEVLPDAIRRAVFRIVQEGLANAVRHAPGASVDVTVACTLRGVELTVTNGPATRPGLPGLLSGGSGLLGARERAVALGGELTTVVLDGGGFRLAATLPVPPPPAMVNGPAADGQRDGIA